MAFFVRLSTNPAADLRRGCSYPMGSFGEEGEAHVGLSGYSATSRSLAGAIEALDHRLGVHGQFKNNHTGRDVAMRLAMFEGTEVGSGPDGEELFRPARVVASILTSRSSDPEHALGSLLKKARAAGFPGDGA